MSGGGWFDWLPGLFGGSGGGAAGAAGAGEMFGPKATLAPPDPTGIIGMVPGGMQDQVPPPVSQTSAAYTGAPKTGWQNQLQQAMQRYQQAQGRQQQPGQQQHMSTWFGPRRIG